ncbi:lytic murein transglycosylase [Sphingomonas sp. NSE70-1]|uniref:Lytic murein transglycosylase n=1 Tax=Sphingomonas caseinilyticus TaxID=2908205 RepID=A0ABT0RR59_9SPHN|nr:lytic murein transglycosylase [Sphingomonas caseinilyticus]MCL6697489.1 lytic murein transglycosylase [Sphingomonas caseinilyticus]
MRVALTLAVLIFGTSASAQVDPLAPLPAAPPQPVVQQAAQPVAASSATSSQMGFAAYKQRLSSLARSAGVREATIQSVIPYLSLNSSAIRLDRAQPGQINNPNATPPFAPYRRKHVTSDLIRRGAAKYREHYSRLMQIEQRMGVPASVILGIYGKETSYGRITGNFDVPDVLASLAYEGRRRDLFESEFVAALKLIDLGYSRSRLRGSWAGAMGYPQFMPSVVLRLRADGDGDGYADIWRSEDDAFASIGNYLRDAGWKAGMLWGVPVRVPSGFNRAAVRNPVTSTECPRVHARHSRPMTMAQWRALGVVPVSRSHRETDMATLIEPDGPGETAYLVTDNYRAILKYNCSNFYALSVLLLADGIIGR